MLSKKNYLSYNRLIKHAKHELSMTDSLNSNQSSQKNLYTIIALVNYSLFIGVLCAWAALLFRYLIGFFHNLLFFSKISINYSAETHTKPSILGAWIILAPPLASILVTWLIKNFSPEAKGHGIPEVMAAVKCNNGKIRPIVVLIKAFASAITIGSGGSVGREGPIALICSAVGSTIGGISKFARSHRDVFVAAGASAGIAATFNAPLAGIIFSLELILPEINNLNISVIAIATVTATYISRYLTGLSPAFNIPELTIPKLHLHDPGILLLFPLLGIFLGIASAIFIQLLTWSEIYFNKLRLNEYLTHVLGMTIIGVMFYIFFTTTGYYYIDGVGYSTIMDILRGLQHHFGLLIVLCIAKLFATCITLGSGGSGGIFSPSLYLGATFGAACGILFDSLFPSIRISPIIFAITGMAGMVGGTTGATLTSVVMTFEMTRDYNVILPIILTTYFAHFIRSRLIDDSIYTKKLGKKGIKFNAGLYCKRF